MGDLANGQDGLNNLVTAGGFEDGYSAVDFAIQNYTLSSTAKNFILVTDEDRDNGNAALTGETIFSALTGIGAILNVIVNNPFFDADGNRVLGVNDTLEAYSADGAGGFSTSAGGTVGNGFGTTETDYVDLALQTGGAAWDLNQLRSGGLLAESFTASFLDIKVQEVVEQINDGTPPSTGGGSGVTPIPLPASFPLVAAGIGVLTLMRRRNKA